MSTQVFLGSPPPHIEAWIKANFKPTANPLSFLEYSGTTITGLKKDPNLNQRILYTADNGKAGELLEVFYLKKDNVQIVDRYAESLGRRAFDEEEYSSEMTVEEGNLDDCGFIQSFEGPRVKSLESYVFYACNSLTSVKLPNLEQATTQSFLRMYQANLSVFLDNTTDIELVKTILNNFPSGSSGNFGGTVQVWCPKIPSGTTVSTRDGIVHTVEDTGWIR